MSIGYKLAKVKLDHVTLSFPLLGKGSRQRVEGRHLTGAGFLTRGGGNKSESVAALNNICLDLKDGDRLGLIGRNGSGKSTLLRLIAGIYEPQHGHVDVQGIVASLFSIGLASKPEATGYRNIELSGLMAGYNLHEIRELTPAIEKFSGLGEYLGMPVRTYSNGMAMRLRFASGTAFDPDILLMDEWLGAGDPTFQEKAERRMQELVEKAGIMVLASHNHNTIKKNCNKVLWLDQGICRALGGVDDVLTQYTDS